MVRPDWDIQLTTNFWLSEFQCKCGCGFGRARADVALTLVDGLQEMRRILGRPLYIVHRLPDDVPGFYTAGSGCRCGAHNKAVGGSPRSYHLRGMAADVWGHPVEDLMMAATQVRHFLNGGIGRYDAGQFLHVDVRSYPARW